MVRQLHRPQPQGFTEVGAVCTMHQLGHATCPPGHLQHPMSQEGQKDHQGQQLPEPLPVHPATIQKVRSVQEHQSWYREADKQYLSQGHQTVKQPSLTQRLLPRYRLEIIGHFNKWITSHFNNATLMFTYLASLISYVYTVFYILYCILPSRRHCSSICIYSYSIPLLRCIVFIYIYIPLFQQGTQTETNVSFTAGPCLQWLRNYTRQRKRSQITQQQKIQQQIVTFTHRLFP